MGSGTSIRYSNPPDAPAPVGQYTNIAVVPPGASTIYVAGQLPTDENGEVVAPGDFERQAELVFERLAGALRSVNSSLREVVQIRAYFVDDAHFPLFREARLRAFERHQVRDPAPATTIVVKGLYGGSLIELDAVAVAPAPRD